VRQKECPAPDRRRADDRLTAANRQFKTWLKSESGTLTDLEIPSFANVRPLWRLNLAQLPPLLFQ
jgi:hypothetical protein